MLFKFQSKLRTCRGFEAKSIGLEIKWDGAAHMNYFTVVILLM